MWPAVAATASGPGTPRPAGWPPAKACQTRSAASPRSADTAITRRRSRLMPRASRARDGEGLQIVLGPVGIEDAGLAQREAVLDHAAVGRLLAQGPHGLAAPGGQKHLLGDLAVVHVGLEIAPALHLGEYPDRHGLVGERIEVDPVRYIAGGPEAVREHAGQHLLEHLDGLVQEVAWRDPGRDLLLARPFGRVLGGGGG